MILVLLLMMSLACNIIQSYVLLYQRANLRREQVAEARSEGLNRAAQHVMERYGKWKVAQEIRCIDPESW